mgnify:CR=1 FL=1
MTAYRFCLYAVANFYKLFTMKKHFITGLLATFAIAELLTMNNIKLFGTTIQENINNSMWNYGAALSLIMLLLIAATSLFSTDDKDNANEGGGLW